MKRTICNIITISALFLLMLPGIALSKDFQSMTTEQLSELRGTMFNAPQEERDAFRAEWRNRINQMSPEEKEQFLGAGGGRGQGNRSGDGLGDGSGRGKGGAGSGSNANGNGNGPGNGGGGSQ